MEELFRNDGEEEYIKGLDCLRSNEQWHIRKALDYFKKAASKGHKEAIFHIGCLYLYGKPQVLQNEKIAFECFKASTEEGCIVANYYLGECYLSGIGVEIDIKKAIYFFEKALKYDIYIAADKLSDIYQNGIGIEKDLDKALYYNEIARKANIHCSELKYFGLLLNK